MKEYFDIFGTPIKFDSIKEFRIVQKEYIFRPAYEEYQALEKKMFNRVEVQSKLAFKEMVPFAAIYDESDRRGVFSNIKSNTFKQSIGKEILGDFRETIGDKFNIKAIKGKKYKCKNQTGRIFSVYLDDIPAVIFKLDGRIIDVHKDDELYSLLGEPITPAINIVHALQIKANEEYVFWGNGIQIDDIGYEYERLKYEYAEYLEEKKGNSKKKGFFINKKDKENKSIEMKEEKELFNIQKVNIPFLSKKDKE